MDPHVASPFDAFNSGSERKANHTDHSADIGSLRFFTKDANDLVELIVAYGVTFTRGAEQINIARQVRQQVTDLAPENVIRQRPIRIPGNATSGEDAGGITLWSHRSFDQAQSIEGTITLFADCHAAEIASASLAFSRGNRCETISPNGNCFCVVRRNSIAIFIWRGSLDQEPNTLNCL